MVKVADRSTLQETRSARMGDGKGVLVAVNVLVNVGVNVKLGVNEGVKVSDGVKV